MVSSPTPPLTEVNCWSTPWLGVEPVLPSHPSPINVAAPPLPAVVLLHCGTGVHPDYGSKMSKKEDGGDEGQRRSIPLEGRGRLPLAYDDLVFIVQSDTRIGRDGITLLTG